MSPLPADAAQLELLYALVDRKHLPRLPQTLAQIKKRVTRPDLAPALDALASSGQVERSATSRSVKYAVSVELAAALAGLVPPPKAKAARPRAADKLAALEQRILAAILPRLERLERAVGASGPESAAGPMAAGPRALTDDELIGLVHEVANAERLGALVPLGRLRQRSGLDRPAFDARLLALERAFKLDLKVADDPHRADAADGIEVPGRGLVLFAVDRRSR